MSTCPHNGIEIKSWFGEDLDDTELLKLIPILKSIVENEEKDVRFVIKKYNENLNQSKIDLDNINKPISTNFDSLESESNINEDQDYNKKVISTQIT